MIKIKINSSWLLSKFIDQFDSWCSKYGKDRWNLIYLIFTWKKWILSIKFKKNASNTPNIHFFWIMTISEQNLRRSIPSCRDIFSIRWRWMRIYVIINILLQEPKSANLMTLSPETRIFSGLMSLWKISFSWI